MNFDYTDAWNISTPRDVSVNFSEINLNDLAKKLGVYTDNKTDGKVYTDNKTSTNSNNITVGDTSSSTFTIHSVDTVSKNDLEEKVDELNKKIDEVKRQSRTFYDDDMLDELLREIIRKKADEADEKLRKAIEDGKRRRIDNFSNLIRNVYLNDPYTVIIWKDGAKTIVKCQDTDEWDPEKGFAMALLKGILGDTNYFNTIFKKWVYNEDK